MKINQLRHFVAAAEELHLARAADKLDIPLAMMNSSIAAIEAEIGQPVFVRTGEGTKLTKIGTVLLEDARADIAAAPAPVKKATNGGGKAKASKGKGRAPAVKGEPKPFKKRQGR
ncbi:LysR family transcriptional regulator [Leifsonia sp. A12D58]|uniref:LysR family transcriptional regulator n=1 Tax=Leifsonia sp. A12D58 TaxID=3397674 RepID=UPI0039DF8597